MNESGGGGPQLKRPRAASIRFRLPQRLVVPPYVMDGLPEGLADTGVSFPNGQRSELSGVVIEAGPSYGTSGEAHAGIRRGAAMGTEGVDDHSR